MPAAEAYSVTMYLMAGLLALGFLCNMLIKPLVKIDSIIED